MLSLNARVDGFRFKLPKTFIFDEVKEKYSKLLNRYNGFLQDPIEFLNESIKTVSILGFNDASNIQSQPFIGEDGNSGFMQTASDISYRSQMNPISFVDKTLVITFRHTLGFVNYFMLFENFFHQYSRDTKETDIDEVFEIELLDVNQEIYSKVQFYHPVIDGIEQITFDYTLPVSSNSQFTVTFKYSDLKYQFIDVTEE